MSYLPGPTINTTSRPHEKQVVQDPKTGQTSVSYTACQKLDGPEDVDRLLKRAAKLRSVGATAMNEHSSRSHMVFTISVTGSNSQLGQSVSGTLLVGWEGGEDAHERVQRWGK